MNNLFNINLEFIKGYDEKMHERIVMHINTVENQQFFLDLSSLQPNIIYEQDKDNRHFLYDLSEVGTGKWLNEYSQLQAGSYDVIMYGLGLSYHLADLIQYNSLLNFYIYEPNIAIFVEALKVINFEDIVNHPQVKLIKLGPNADDIEEFIYYKNLMSTELNFSYIIPFYINLNETHVKDYYEMDYVHTNNEMVVSSFLSYFGPTPFRNSIKNLKHVTNSAPLTVVENIFKGCTAIVVGSGPSLEREIQLIKKNEKNLLIVAAGSAIQSLLKHDITPHIIVSIDPGEANGRVFENIDYSNIPLAFDVQIYPQILNNKNEGLFHLRLQSDPIFDTLTDVVIEPNFYTTPSVSGTSMQVAKYLGAQKIALVGQDASFPNDQYYASGTVHIKENLLNNKVELSDLEVENVNGGINKTNVSMNIIREGLEHVIEKNDDQNVDFINCSSLGAVIKGAPFKPLEEVIQGINIEKKYNFAQLNTISKDSSQIIKDRYGFIAMLEEKVTEIEMYQKVCKKSLKLVSDFEIAARKSNEKANAKLLKLENEVSKMTEAMFFNKFTVLWCRSQVREYDRLVKSIVAEKDMIKKAKLLREILVPFLKIMQDVFIDIKTELQDVIKQIKEVQV